MIFREFLAKQKVLRCRKKTIGDVFVQRHAALPRSLAEDPRTQSNVIFSISDHSRHRNNQFGRILIVRMHHDHDVGVHSQGLAIAGLLIATITEIGFVLKSGESQPARQLHRLVRAVVIHQQNFVNDALRDVVISLLQRLGCVVSRHDDDKFLSVQHGPSAQEGIAVIIEGKNPPMERRKISM